MKNNIKFCLLEVNKSEVPHKEESTEQISSIDEQKHLAWYEQGISAWLQTKMEHDKTMLTISSIFVGFIATIFAALFKDSITLITFIIMMISIISFVSCMITTAVIFNKNADYLEAYLKGTESSETEKRTKTLKRLDSISNKSFYIGIAAFVVFIFLLGFCAIQTKCLAS